MTPAEHIAEAERLLQAVADQATPVTPDEQRFWAQLAQGHALIAVAVELGAPHPAAPAGGEPSAPQPPPG